MKALLQVKMAMHKKIEAITNPAPQITGSDRANFGRSLTLKILPTGTPTTPDNMVTIPKIKGMLKNKNKIFISQEINLHYCSFFPHICLLTTTFKSSNSKVRLLKFGLSVEHKKFEKKSLWF